MGSNGSVGGAPHDDGAADERTGDDEAAAEHASGDETADARTDDDDTEGGRNSDQNDGTDGGCSCKLGRSRRTYGIDRLDDRLGRRHADGASLRDLERFVNEAILERAIRDADADLFGGVGPTYETFVGEDASAGERTALRERLASAGVDVETVESDFVSYQTVRTHLRDCLDVDTDRDTTLSLEDGRGTIEWARSRSEGIVERTLDRLARNDAVVAGDLDVTHSIRVSCTDCGRSAPLQRFLDDSGCDCTDLRDDEAPDEAD